MTDRTPSLLHPFRTPRLTGSQVGWFRPAAAVLIAMIVPAVLAIVFVAYGAPTISGPPKDGTGYSIADHIALVFAALAASFIVSWMLAPLALLLLRAAAMLGYAGWGTAILTSLLFGLPLVHVVLNGDVTTEEKAILPHMTIAIGLLGLSVWGAFWGLIALKRKPPNFPAK